MDEPADRIHSMVESIVKELVDDRDGLTVAVLASAEGRTLIITVRPAGNDIGKVIGRGGRTAQAIRTIIEAIAARLQMKIQLEIDDKNSERKQQQSHW
ncbi:hypothetical protein LCGC14_0320170 [marine sediment metagenome]|uniref:Uncharacterized protein n=1 Tax=marine sediment metagenome TaxID=412755 RepID=A0A0F9TQ13_9ZZZZ